MSRKFSRICFTIHDPAYVADDAVNIQRAWDTDKLSFIIYQVEKTQNNTEHIQGYAEFKSPLTVGSYGARNTGIKAVFHCNTMHIEAARGNAEQNIKYCTKEESRVRVGLRIGEPSRQGSRHDIAALYETARDQKTNAEDLWNYGPDILKYFKGAFGVWEATHQPPPRPNPEFFLLIGRSGSGKTRWAHDNYPRNYRLFDQGAKWWDGYLEQKEVLIDDFDGQSIPIAYMLQLLDRWPMRVPIKGGSRPLSATKFIITSNIDWEEWWPEARIEHRDAFARRVREYGHVLTEQDYHQDEPAQAEEIKINDAQEADFYVV